MAEHKLTATGLVDPENAKKLGMFAGVDAFIMGNMITLSQDIELTAKIITTDTAEIVGAAKSKFRIDETVKQLMSRPAADTSGGAIGAQSADDAPKVIKTFGDMRVEIQSLHIINGNQLMLSLSLTNQNQKNSIWVALSTEMFNVKSSVTDSEGSEFRANRTGVSGIACTSYGPYSYQPNTFSPATEIKPNDSISATVKFGSTVGRAASPGHCNLQVELLLGHNFAGGAPAVNTHNFTGKVDAN